MYMKGNVITFTLYNVICCNYLQFLVFLHYTQRLNNQNHHHVYGFFPFFVLKIVYYKILYYKMRFVTSVHLSSVALFTLMHNGCDVRDYCETGWSDSKIKLNERIVVFLLFIYFIVE